MFFLSKLFKKSPVKKLLGGGLILSVNEEKFYVASETYFGLREKNVTIIRENIRKIINGNYKDTSDCTKMTDLEKNQIAFKTKKLLEAEGFNVIVSPEFPLEFSIKNK